MRSLFQKGNRLFTAINLWVVLVAIGHTTAIMGPVPEEGGVQAAVDAMSEARFAEEGADGPSLLDVFVGAWIQVGALLVGMAIVSLAGLAGAGPAKGAKQVLIIANLVVYVPLAIVFVVVFIPPPLIAFAVTSVLFGVDLFLTKRSQAA